MEKDNIVRGADRWVDELLESYGVKKLSELPKQVLKDEIALAKAAIANCRLWGDEYGINDNEKYSVLLEEALYETQIPELIPYISEQITESQTEYKVRIIETFQRTIKVKAANENVAIAFVKDLYNRDEIIIDADDYTDTKFIAEGDII